MNYYYSYQILNHEQNYARTFAFMLLAMLHLIHSFEARSLTESALRRDVISSNPTLAVALVVSVGFLVLGCYLPGLNTVLELEALRATEWGIIAINIVAHVFVVEVRKAAIRWHMDRNKKNVQQPLQSEMRGLLSAHASAATAAGVSTSKVEQLEMTNVEIHKP